MFHHMFFLLSGYTVPCHYMYNYDIIALVDFVITMSCVLFSFDLVIGIHYCLGGGGGGLFCMNVTLLAAHVFPAFSKLFLW